MKHKFDIKLNKNISISDIEKDWPNDLRNISSIDFLVLKDFSFTALAEGFALAVLRELNGNDIEITISINGSYNEALEIPEQMYSLFGLQLLYFCKSASYTGSGKDCSRELGQKIWSLAYENRGLLDRGKSKYFLARSNQPASPVLCQIGHELKFPKDAVVFKKSFLSAIASTKKDGDTWSTNEEDLAEWVLHNAENSFQHGSIERDRPIQGFRGIIVKRFKFESQNLAARDDFPAIIKNHFLTRIKSGESFETKMFFVVSVVDDGVGITESLNDLYQETGFSLLNKAFENGVSGKNYSSDYISNEKPKREGYGLGDMMDAASRLKALVYVTSGNLSAYYDFSELEQDLEIKEVTFNLNFDREVSSKRGTCVSLIWANPNSFEQDKIV